MCKLHIADIITAASLYVIGPSGRSVDLDCKSKKLAVAHAVAHPNENDTRLAVNMQKKLEKYRSTKMEFYFQVNITGDCGEELSPNMDTVHSFFSPPAIKINKDSVQYD